MLYVGTCRVFLAASNGTIWERPRAWKGLRVRNCLFHPTFPLHHFFATHFVRCDVPVLVVGATEFRARPWLRPVSASCVASVDVVSDSIFRYLLLGYLADKCGNYHPSTTEEFLQRWGES